MMAPDRLLAIMAYSGAQESAVLGLADLLDAANLISTGQNGVVIKVSTIRPEDLAQSRTSFDALILPPNRSGARGAEDQAVHSWIRQQHGAGTLTASVCAGVFWLGHAGLLSSRPVTTHWALEDEFRQTFPDADLQPEHLLIDDNDIVTAGGMMAWVDLGLFFVERWQGIDVLTSTARHLLIDPGKREQRNYRSFRPNLHHGDETILALQLWMEGHVEDDLSAEALELRTRLSGRTFLRRFKAATGVSPNAYVQALRIEKARGLLERTREPVSAVGWSVGYQDISAFGRVFRSITGLSAVEYRRRFSVLDVRR
ncbi:transcriptional regulator, AraC family with amidase-like domain [Hoeflea sp. IMCC20628]|uniref:GlxA family transcriptional regulator n=1 Tax=Hoeflea sp. IMCC20628 TaxID=1620421 RepID=UPI00063BEFA7|nr:helix-turn-helix domain-containing protein [Hoeflea sp. IMCC20628]AKH99925.1 transcriptional regulator, AraC family with amidase-like domain [Hoeflea sp. IMCC20628]